MLDRGKKIEVRIMKDSDWEDVAAIYKQGIASNYATFETDCPDYEKWDASHHEKGRFVILQDGKIRGWCALSPISNRLVYAGVAEVSIYIDESCRGKGLGKYLLTTLCKECENDFWTLQASIFMDNDASVALHKKCGFRMVGYREQIAKDIMGNWRNTVLMERKKHG